MTPEPVDERNTTDQKTGGPAKIAAPIKVFRATTALVVFGLPLAVGACTIIGYGVRQAYKRITGSR